MKPETFNGYTVNITFDEETKLYSIETIDKGGAVIKNVSIDAAKKDFLEVMGVAETITKLHEAQKAVKLRDKIFGTLQDIFTISTSLTGVWFLISVINYFSTGDFNWWSVWAFLVSSSLARTVVVLKSDGKTRRTISDEEQNVGE